MHSGEQHPLLARLQALVPEFECELDRIAQWWLVHGIDNLGGGYVSSVGNDGKPAATGEKTVVAQSRLLWFFSKMAIRTQEQQFFDAAEHGAEFLLSKFVDERHGGVYWSVDEGAQPLNRRKQTYGQAFAVFALAAFGELGANRAASQAATELFLAIEHRLRDREHNGYDEGRGRSWAPLDDPRLSDRDQPSAKSMNTHLHVLEAYSGLLMCYDSPLLREALGNLIDLHSENILRPGTGNLRLFWSRDWQDQSEAISFGHNIEASWLLSEAAERLGEEARLSRARDATIALAESVLSDAVGPHGELFNERALRGEPLDKSRIWWVQAEAMVGHLNAFQLTDQPCHAERVWTLWAFIKEHVIDREKGEWRWYSAIDQEASPYIAGPWKSAYHNGRSLMECTDRIRALCRVAALAAE